MTTHDALKEIFKRSPLPPGLKSAKHRWLKNELSYNAQIRIIEKYLPGKVELKIYKTKNK